MQSLRSELEIKSKWNDFPLDPLVSICCITFNHVDFIEDALKGFLNQNTTFPFEIIIHDDASNDGTSEIVKSYLAAYPTIIRLVLQTENQYSLGRKITASLLPLCRGKYIALCEGDDYWIDNDKLTKQIDTFRRDEEVSIVFHKALELNHYRKEISPICDHFDSDRFISSSLAFLKRGSFMPTASLVFKNTEIYPLIEILNHSPVADFFIQTFFSLNGKVVYLNFSGSIYRTNINGSWSSLQKDQSKKIKTSYDMFRAVDYAYGVLKSKNRSWYLGFPLSFYLISYSWRQPTKIKKIKAFFREFSRIRYFSRSLLVIFMAFCILEYLYKYRKRNHLVV